MPPATRRCPICGAAHLACGSATDVKPVDHMTPASEAGMPLKRYRVGDAILKLNDEDAKKMGLTGEAAEPPPEVVSSQSARPRSAKRPAPREKTADE